MVQGLNKEQETGACKSAASHSAILKPPYSYVNSAPSTTARKAGVGTRSARLPDLLGVRCLLITSNNIIGCTLECEYIVIGTEKTDFFGPVIIISIIYINSTKKAEFSAFTLK